MDLDNSQGGTYDRTIVYYPETDASFELKGTFVCVNNVDIIEGTWPAKHDWYEWHYHWAVPIIYIKAKEGGFRKAYNFARCHKKASHEDVKRFLTWAENRLSTYEDNASGSRDRRACYWIQQRRLRVFAFPYWFAGKDRKVLKCHPKYENEPSHIFLEDMVKYLIPKGETMTCEDRSRSEYPRPQSYLEDYL